MTPSQVQLLSTLLKEEQYDIHINLTPRLGMKDMEDNEENRVTKIHYENSHRRKALAFTPAFNINLFSLTSEEVHIIKKPSKVHLFNSGVKPQLGTFQLAGITYYRKKFYQVRIGDLTYIDNSKCMGIVSGILKEEQKIKTWVIQKPINVMEEVILSFDTEVIVIEPLINKLETDGNRKKD